jgi:cation:H+ antiporter
MNAALPLAGMVAALVLLLLASEVMVRELTSLGQRFGFVPALLGFVVAIAADSPEVSTAIVALVAGSQEIGVGVVEGSNIYNLAGLLGLSALIAGPLAIRRRRVTEDGSLNLALTVLTIALVLVSAARLPLAVCTLALFGGYVLTTVRHASRGIPAPGPIVLPATLAMLATAGVVLASALLVHESVQAIHRLHIAQSVVGLFVLPIATSLPNTWAALSLARRGMADALVATTFSSNSINLALGIAAPSLLLQLHPGNAERALDGPYLLGMTTTTLLLLLSGSRLARREAVVIIALYLAFVIVRSDTIA